MENENIIENDPINEVIEDNNIVEDDVIDNENQIIEDNILEQPICENEDIIDNNIENEIENEDRTLVFVSTPMLNKSKSEIHLSFQIAANKLSAEVFNGKEIEVIDTYIEENYDNALLYMAKSIELLSKANYVYFCKGWENARGCRIEHECAIEYKIPILYER